jgi:ATP-binding cassette subfamily F protein uup
VILVDADNVAIRHGDRTLFEDLSVTVATGDRLGVVGLNGTGKSTLLALLADELQPDKGEVRRGRNVRTATLSQRPQVGGPLVRDALDGSWQSEAVLDRLGMGGRLDDQVATLSGGEAKRVALAAALVAESDLLILDEPTNHLDIDAIAWLEDHLASYRGGVLIVTHDRHLLDRVANRVIEIESGQAWFHDGGYSGYLAGRARREEVSAAAEAVRRNLATRELQWLRRGAPARTSKAKARIRSAEELIAGGERPATRGTELDLHVGTQRLGDKVLDLHGLTHGYDDEPDLFSGLDLLLDRRERLGIVGPNGAGKSTLLDVAAGRIAPKAGTVETGQTVKLGYFDQVGRQLDPSMRLREALVGEDRELTWREVGLLERFWFDADQQFAPIDTLSGGERRRLQLLLVLVSQPNVLLLDEPTNDLDLDTLRSLEDFLEDWPGALLVVSHDRAFLERTVDDVIIVDGKGNAGRYPGGYEAWDRDRGRMTSGNSPAARTRSAEASREVPAAKPRSKSTLRHSVRQLDKRIETLTAERDQVAAALAGAGGADHQQLAELGLRLEVLNTDVAAAEDEWLELSTELEQS